MKLGGKPIFQELIKVVLLLDAYSLIIIVFVVGREFLVQFAVLILRLNVQVRHPQPKLAEFALAHLCAV